MPRSFKTPSKQRKFRTAVSCLFDGFGKGILLSKDSGGAYALISARMKMIYEIPKQTSTSANRVVMWGQIRLRL